MKKLLFILLLFASHYGFGGCTDHGYITLNGKLLTCFCIPGTPEPGIPRDSSYDPTYGGAANVTIYMYPTDSVVLSIGDGYENNYISYAGSRYDTASVRIQMAGMYFFETYTLNGGCGVNFSVLVVYKHPSTIETLTDQSSPLKVISNPVQSVLNLYSENTIRSIHIYDQLGRLQLQPEVKSSSQNYYQSDIETLAKGVYMIEAILENGNREIRKIVKE